MDGHRQWFKSRQGLPVCELPRAPALCDHAIREAKPLVVPDTLQDKRFAESAFVVGEPHLRFYAGAPLTTREGHNIGTVCAMDTRPRTFGPEQVEILSDLAQLVMTELDLRKLAAVDGLTGALSRRAFRDEPAAPSRWPGGTARNSAASSSTSTTSRG